MKHIQPFALFESESPKRDLSDALWDLLVSRVTLPELCKTDTVAWSCIIDLYSHDEYLESYENNFDEDDEVKSDPMEEKNTQTCVLNTDHLTTKWHMMIL